MKVLLPLLVASLLFACRKEIYQRDSKIHMGNKLDMEFTEKFALNLNGNAQTPESYSIDLDDDGKNDIRLISADEASIVCLHSSAKLMVQQIQDSTFVNESTQYTISPTGEQMYIQATTYSCEKETPLYELDTAETRLILDPKLYGNKITVEDPFQFLTFPFEHTGAATLTPTGTVVQGVVYYDLINYFNDCWDYPSGGYYIGVKLYTPSGPKLGWILMSVSSLGKINIENWAIQR